LVLNSSSCLSGNSGELFQESISGKMEFWIKKNKVLGNLSHRRKEVILLGKQRRYNYFLTTVYNPVLIASTLKKIK